MDDFVFGESADQDDLNEDFELWKENRFRTDKESKFQPS